MEQTCGGLGRAKVEGCSPGPPSPKPEDGGLEAVRCAPSGCVASYVDELGVHAQLQNDCQQLKPS